MTRLLAFDNDATLLLPQDSSLGDSHQRQLQYATILEQYHMVTLAANSTSEPIQISNNFTVYPVSQTMRRYLRTAVPLGRRLVQQHGITLVSAQDPFLTGLAAYRVARRFNLPFSLQFAADMLDNPHWLRLRPFNRLMNWLGHWLIRRADSFRVVSSSEKAKLIRLGIPAERIWNLGWITDFSRFVQAEGTAVRQAFPFGAERQILLFLGRLVPQKNLPALLHIFRQVQTQAPEARLVIAGEGPEREALTLLAQQLGIGGAIHFTGFLPYEQVPQMIAAADLFVLSSIYEGNARVIAEAAAAGKAAVSTAVSGASDSIIHGETGFVVPIGDIDQFAAHVLTLLGNQARREEMGRTAQAHILQLYDTERLLDGFRELWQVTETAG